MSNLDAAFPSGAGAPPGGSVDAARVAALPAQIKVPYLQAFTDAIAGVFVVAGVVAVLAFVLSWFVQERELRETVATSGVGEAFAAPQPDDSLAAIGRALSRLAGRDRTRRFIAMVAAESGVDLSPAACWLLFRYREDPEVAIADLARARGIPFDVLEAGRTQLAQHAQIEDGPDHTTRLTPAGLETSERLRAHARVRLVTLLDGWSPELYPELERLLTRLGDDIAQAPPERTPALTA